MRAGGAGLISGRSSAYPEVYAALTAALAAGEADAVARHQRTLDRIVALGQSIGRLKYALQLRDLGGTTARMAVDPPDAEVAAAIAAELAALLPAALRCTGERALLPVGAYRPRAVAGGCEPGARAARPVFKRSGVERGAGPWKARQSCGCRAGRPGESGHRTAVRCERGAGSDPWPR